MSTCDGIRLTDGAAAGDVRHLQPPAPSAESAGRRSRAAVAAAGPGRQYRGLHVRGSRRGVAVSRLPSPADVWHNTAERQPEKDRVEAVGVGYCGNLITGLNAFSFFFLASLIVADENLDLGCRK